MAADAAFKAMEEEIDSLPLPVVPEFTDSAEARLQEQPAFNEALAAAGTAAEEEISRQDELIDRMGSLINAMEQQTVRDSARGLGGFAAGWALDPAVWQSGGGSGGITSAVLQQFRGLPASIAAAAASGTAKGVSGITVQLDGYTVGRLVAPYVSESIARDVII